MLSNNTRIALSPHRSSRNFTYASNPPSQRSASKSTDREDSTCFDTLSAQLSSAADSFAAMHDHLEQLQPVGDALTHFNKSFGAFLQGMAVNGTTVHFPEAPVRSSFEKHKSRVQKRAPLVDNTTIIRDRARAVHESDRVERPERSEKKAAAPTNTIPSSKPAESAPKTSPNPKRRFTSKIIIRKIIDRLPLEYREQAEPMKNMEAVLKLLRTYPNGLNMEEIVKAVDLPKYKLTDCLNALVRSKDVMKQTQRGQLATFRLEPARYPSMLMNVRQ